MVRREGKDLMALRKEGKRAGPQRGRGGYPGEGGRPRKQEHFTGGVLAKRLCKSGGGPCLHSSGSSSKAGEQHNEGTESPELVPIGARICRQPGKEGQSRASINCRS